MRILIPFLVLLPALLLAGCSAFDLINAVSPDGSYRLEKGLAYGPDPRQRLDLALPEGRPVRGLVVFFYGGGWTRGHRDDYRFIIEPFATRGYAVAIPDYRVYPAVRFPDFVDDGARALAWLLEDAGERGIANVPLALAGHSAGAHIAAMIAFDERFAEAHEVDPGAIGAFVGLSGPYDFLPLTSDELKRIFAPPSRYPASQPVNFVDGGEAPTLLVHGADDTIAWPRNSQRLAARIRERGGIVEERYLEGVGHRRVALALSPTFSGTAEVIDPVLDFLDRYLEAPEARDAITSGN